MWCPTSSAVTAGSIGSRNEPRQLLFQPHLTCRSLEMTVSCSARIHSLMTRILWGMGSSISRGREAES